MEKQDIRYVILALSIVIILALVVKPAITGKPANTGLPTVTPTVTTLNGTQTPATSSNQSGATNQTQANNTNSVVSGNGTTTNISGNGSGENSTPPLPSGLPFVGLTTTQTLSTSFTPKTVPFVDPARYNVSVIDTYPTMNVPKPDGGADKTTRVFATINGRWSGTTDVIHIPYPYFEIWYTLTTTVSPDVVVPKFSMQVVDAEDPNRFVRVITPPGNSYGGPFVEKFFEGNHDYYFIINTKYIQSYSIEVRIPQKYLQNSTPGSGMPTPQS
ncbi:hypothetical protein [Methanosphaerula palustris]|uniref:Uncharacterized protein n=1 Tax=Methanosphaerula palustris (strain ATCC BAA-1556 / DSM 19958 / E1-9c) TaxID=521011 RepID=B8GEH0_METPE|nr:hypothetical protein [Methanosphaerula palustris]ACL17671.1 conserved hypothetical protein [Methanosphaerula palustris E1-9c]